MKRVALAAAVCIGIATGGAAAASKAYVGVVTDTMCVANHEAMKVAPDDRCVRECVGDATTFKYALLSGGRFYLLSDQETPARFAGVRVKVTGVLYTKTNVLKLERIERDR